jgi:hypothetical protein
LAISIDWGTKIITVEQADLTNISGANYSLDVDVFRLALKDLEDSEEGIAFPMTHNHVAPISVGGVTLARVVEIINGYTISFEDTGTPYSVRLDGANNNIGDVANLITNVSIRSSNSAGLIQVDTGGGAVLTANEILDNQDIETGISFRQSLRLVLSALAGKVSGAGTTTISIRDLNDTVDRIVATVDTNGNRTAITKDVT